MKKLFLGINIDHIATLRNVRGTTYPDPVQTAFIAEQAGADTITVHLREDRRHITDRDIHILRQTLTTQMNLEIAATEEMLDIACSVKPDFCCLVPEKRQEITTESGLNIVERYKEIHDICVRLLNSGIKVSLFINADLKQIKAAINIGVPYIEIHTGYYADAKDEFCKKEELNKILEAIEFAASFGLKINAGHGLNYHNVQSIAMISKINELNIGHAIISRAVIVGFKKAVKEMKYLISEARR